MYEISPKSLKGPNIVEDICRCDMSENDLGYFIISFNLSPM